ncbi:MAG: type II toxin-antitoxin system VapC family toxin [Chloroflexi bacterium]|nr:type II toxin-antitoxin system VapC family toxin [Chloroflexota bacterium]
MRLYLDSSALVKLVQHEAESDALRRFLRARAGDERVASEVVRVEVVRSVLHGGPAAVAHARRQLARLYLLVMDRQVLDTAATLAPGSVLRSLDAIHLATAQLLGSELRTIVTYDARMAQAAAGLGLSVAAPTDGVSEPRLY